MTAQTEGAGSNEQDDGRPRRKGSDRPFAWRVPTDMDAWMERLANGIQAGYYKIEDGTEPLTLIPKEIMTPRYVRVDLRQLAEGFLTPLDGDEPILIDTCLDVALDALVLGVTVWWGREMSVKQPRNMMMADAKGRYIFLSERAATMTPEHFRKGFGAMLGCIAMKSNNWEVGHAWDKGRSACLADLWGMS